MKKVPVVREQMNALAACVVRVVVVLRFGWRLGPVVRLRLHCFSRWQCIDGSKPARNYGTI